MFIANITNGHFQHQSYILLDENARIRDLKCKISMFSTILITNDRFSI